MRQKTRLTRQLARWRRVEFGSTGLMAVALHALAINPLAYFTDSYKPCILAGKEEVSR